MVTPIDIKKDIQKQNNQLDVLKNKLASAQQRNDHEKITHFKIAITKTKAKIANFKKQLSRQNSSKGESIKSLAFNRPLTKAEQADMGKLKKSVRGLVVVHPLTAIGREIGVDVITGFAPKEF
jgi:ribosome-associated protein